MASDAPPSQVTDTGRMPVPPAADEAVAALSRALYEHLAMTLDPRGYRTPALLLTLGRMPSLSIQVLRPPSAPPAAGATQPAAPVPSWRMIAPLQSVFYQALVNTPEARRNVRPNSPLLPFYAVLGCEWAAILARQMGATPEFEIDVARKPPDFEEKLAACQMQATRPSALLAATATHMIGSICGGEGRAMGEAPAEAVATLQVSVVDGVLKLRAFGAGNGELWAEPASSAIRRLAECGARFLLDSAIAEEQRHGGHREAGDQAIQAICLRVAEAAAEAARGDHCVGVRVCRGREHGMPAEVYLILDAARDAQDACQECPQVILEARRAHEEYILQNGGGELYFYPSCQLVSRIIFSPLDGGRWHLDRPRVRAPQGSPVFVHPYVGPLQETALSHTCVLGDPRDEALFPLSADGRAILPPLAPRARVPLENDFCLSDQDSDVYAADTALRNAVKGGQEPDVLSAVRAIWGVARVGLTRGHVRNTRTPRASLCTGMGRFFVANRAALGERLASRIYLYDPNGAGYPYPSDSSSDDSSSDSY